MSRGKYERTGYREDAISDDPQLAVCHGCSNKEQAKSNRRANDDAPVAMTLEAESDRQNTQRHHDNQHLGVQVALGQWCQYRQRAHDQWQREAVQHAEARKADCSGVQPMIVGRSIHE